MNLFVRFVAALFSAVLVIVSADASDKYSIGVYYYPGWSKGSDDPPDPKGVGWARIKSFPDREPALGWYREGEVAVADQQLEWMHEYGIDYVLFDWYWSADDRRRNEDALSAYLKSQNKQKVKFALLWANHDGVPKSRGQLAAIVRFWARAYFSRDEYLKIDGRPAVFIFSANLLKDDAEKFASTTRELLALINQVAKGNGFARGVYLVAGVGAGSPMADKYAPQQGYDALSAYNYQADRFGKEFESYAELDAAYRDHWRWILENSPLPYFIPMSAGWDSRPWGGSRNPLHDNSTGTAREFEVHLRSARDLMDRNPEKTKRMGVICCWNEFGEGSYIEPTKRAGFDYLRSIKRVFGDQHR